MLRGSAAIASVVLVAALAGCAPTFPEPEVLPIFAEEQGAGDEIPQFVLEGDYTLRPETTRYIGEIEGVDVFVALGDVMGSPTNTCLATIVDEEQWMIACSPELPLTSELDPGPAFVLQWPEDPAPEGSFEALGDYVWVNAQP